jgi:hypothetical protein
LIRFCGNRKEPVSGRFFFKEREKIIYFEGVSAACGSCEE